VSFTRFYPLLREKLGEARATAALFAQRAQRR